MISCNDGLFFQKCNVPCADANPIPTDEVVQHFNELRQDIVLLYELKLGLTTCEYELQTLRHQWEQLFPGKVRAIIFTFICILCVVYNKEPRLILAGLCSILLFDDSL